MPTSFNLGGSNHTFCHASRSCAHINSFSPLDNNHLTPNILLPVKHNVFRSDVFIVSTFIYLKLKLESITMFSGSHPKSILFSIWAAKAFSKYSFGYFDPKIKLATIKLIKYLSP